MEVQAERLSLSWRQKAAIFILRYGYANYVPGSRANAIIVLARDWERSPPGTIWEAVGKRAQARLRRNRVRRQSY